MRTPAVTVVMTAFNRERYIAAAIESVLSQTFADFDLLIVDDCSTDRTIDIATRYVSDPRVRIHRNPRNLGDYPNRNHAATLARGEFLKYHDSDDIMYPHCLDVMVSSLESAPEAACALSAGRAWSGGPCPMLLTPTMAFEREYLGQGLFHVGPAGALFRRRVFEKLGGFPEVGLHSDHRFWFTLCAEYAVLLVPSDLFWYRVHSGQQYARPDAAYERVHSERFTWDFIGSSRCPLTQPQREQARRNRAFLTAKLVLADLRQRNWRLAAYRARNSGPRAADWVKYLRPPRRDPAVGSPRDSSGEFTTPRPATQGAAAVFPVTR